MVYGLYLKMDQPKWFRDDFSSDDKLTGTIYTNLNLTTAKNLTGYTLTIRLYKGNRWGDHFGKTATIVTAADGTWSYAVGQGEMPPPAIYNVKLELQKSGTQESTINRVELFVVDGAST